VGRDTEGAGVREEGGERVRLVTVTGVGEGLGLAAERRQGPRARDRQSTRRATIREGEEGAFASAGVGSRGDGGLEDLRA